MAMNEDDILEIWEEISGYQSDWESIILDLLDEVENIRSQKRPSTSDDDYGMALEDTSPDPEAMRDRLVELRSLIQNAVKAALNGDMVQTELEEFFVKASATLSELENEVFEMQELSREFDTAFDAEDELWGSDDEEDY